MSPNDKLYSLFLNDTFRMIKQGIEAPNAVDFDAVDAVSRLRLYIAVTGYQLSLRDLFLSGGLTSKDYDRFLAAYNHRIARRLG